ncbi:MAG: hypothetical protein AAB425_00835 [Bdellovibrionota bacterium]
MSEPESSQSEVSPEINRNELAFIHFGGGPLGLALVIPAILDGLARDVSVFNRQSVRPHHATLAARGEYFVTDGSQRKRVSGFKYVVAPDDERIAGTFLSARHVVVTTAVGEQHLDAACQKIALGLAARISAGVSGGVCILPAENIKGNGEAAREFIARQFARDGVDAGFLPEVLFGNTIPDRACIMNEDAAHESAPGSVEVRTEPYARWDISLGDHASTSYFEPIISGLAPVQIVTEWDMLLIATRKLWCFNALHMVAASRAYRKNILRLADLFDREGERDLLENLAQELSLALHSHSTDKTWGRASYRENMKFCKKSLDRMQSIKCDRTDRILKNLLEFRNDIGKTNIQRESPESPLAEKSSLKPIRTGEMVAFLRKVRERLGAPADILFRDAGSARRVLGTAKRIHGRPQLVIGTELLGVLETMEHVFEELLKVAG